MSKKQTMDFHEAMEEVNLRFDGMIADDICRRPESPLSFREIASRYGLSHVYVCGVATKRNINRPRGGGSPAYPRKALEPSIKQ
jgi:hypothetical protein